MFTSAVDDLLAMTFTSLLARDLPALSRAIEEQLRRLPVLDHALITEMDRRVAAEVGARDTAKVLVEALRIFPVEATLRVRAAADAGPRYGLTGAPLPALFPRIATAQAAGTISVTHARIITTAPSNNSAGRVRWSTVFPGGPHRPGSTRTNNPNETTPATSNDSYPRHHHPRMPMNRPNPTHPNGE